MGSTTNDNAKTMTPMQNFVWVCTSRQIFGAAIAFQMFLMTLPCINDVHWSHPIYMINKILSSILWVPIAALSYSVYLFHITVYMFVGSTSFAVPDATIITECQFDTKLSLAVRYIYVFVLTILLSMVVAFFVYFLVERPCIEARKVFKNKHDKASEIDERKPLICWD